MRSARINQRPCGDITYIATYEDLWVPKTCVTWADALGERSAGRAGLGPSGRAMIFGLWA